MSVRDNRWREEVTAAANAASEPVFFPRRILAVTVKVIPGAAGTAVARFTLDDPVEVSADPDSAHWEDWEPGTVGAPASRALTGPVTALRLEATDDAAEMHVVGAFDY